MSTTDKWEDVRRATLDEGRRRVGPPPEIETVEALFRGELADDEASRLRDVLAYYPELVRIVTATDSPDSPRVLTDTDRAADLARIRHRLGIEDSRTVGARPRRAHVFAWAACLIIGVGIAGVAVMQRSRPAPRPAATKIIVADSERVSRGSSAVPEVILFSSTDYRLKPLYRPARPYGEYRFQLVDRNGATPRTVWTRNGVQRQTDGAFPVELSTSTLEPGRYELVLYGADATVDRLATYTLRVEKQ